MTKTYEEKIEDVIKQNIKSGNYELGEIGWNKFTIGYVNLNKKVLNLYAGIGGNRKLWQNVEVTAVENNSKVAKIYQKNFPMDKVLVEDAHDYLLKHCNEFDFIWSSPPCQSHSGMNNFLNPQGKIRYPDMSLWQEIIYLRHFCKVKWVVENVKSMYYEPLIPAQVSGRHYFWANFIITNVKNVKADIGTFNRSASKIFAQQMNTKNQLERNAVDSKLGLHIFNCAFKIRQQRLTAGVFTPPSAILSDDKIVK